MRFIIIALSLLMFGCSNPGIVKLSNNTYMIFREDHKGVFGSAASLQAEVINDANAFAESKGKVAVPISTNFKPMGGGVAQWASFEYQFVLVDKDDPLAKKSHTLSKRADTVIEKKEEIKVDIDSNKTESEEEVDIYTELTKLNELKEKGIITEEEFDKLKKELLSKKLSD